MAVINDNPVVLHPYDGDSEPAIVAFSALEAKPGHFHFFGLPRLLPESAGLLVRDPSENWYNTGLPGVGDTVEEIAERIKQEVAELGAKRILTIGMSMGGYAAILFGCLMGAERVIALVPQTLLDSRFPERRPGAEVSLQVPDLRPVIRDAPTTKIDLVAAWDDLLDVFHAQRVAEFSSVRILGVPGGHAFVKDLNENGNYWPFITELIEGGTASICEVKSEFEAQTIALLGDAALASGRGDRMAAMRTLIPVAERYPDWTAPDLVAVRSLIAQGRLAEDDP